MRRLLSALIVAGSAGVAALLVTGARPQAAPSGLRTIDAAGWQAVLGTRPPVSTGERYVVLLRDPSLASKVQAAGGTATEEQMRRWTAAALSTQGQFLARVAASGVRVTPEYRYVRVLNGFSARLDATSLAALDRDREVAGVFPVRIAYPASTDQTQGIAATAAVPDLALPGLDGSGVTVALLDTGVDPSHPYLRDSVLPGLDVIDPGSGGLAQPNPSVSGRPERHGTELAGILTGADGPAGLHGVAPGASILPIRIAGWQPDPEGGYAVYARSDQVIAGLEAAVDPNGDGDAHDAARIALIGVAEPFASFADDPLARAVDGATALDVLVVVPAGNDGRAGPTFGSIAGPGGAATALTIGAADGRRSVPTVRLYVQAGLRVLYNGPVALGGSPTRTVLAGLVSISRAHASRGIKGLFTDGGVSTVAGRAVLEPRDALSAETVDEAASAGAVAVLVDGPLPAGAFALDVPAGVPVVGVPAELARTIRTLHAEGVPVTVAVGVVRSAQNTGGGGVAAFSSSGLAFGGALKPELIAPGVSVPTSEPGRSETGDVRYGTVSGTSAAAAAAAGAAALLAQGRPQASAAELDGLLVGSAQHLTSGDLETAAGTIDLEAAAQQEVVAEPSVISFGAGAPGSLGIERTIRVQNVSTRRRTVTVHTGQAVDGVEVTVDPEKLRLRPGGSGTVLVRADLSALRAKPGAAVGALMLQVRRSRSIRVPWGLAIADPRVALLSRVAIRSTGPHVSDSTPAVLSLVAGAIVPGAVPQVRPVRLLEVQLWRSRKLLGVLARRRDLLPGRYSFGLTGRDAAGKPLRHGNYVVRVVARPDDGTRRQVDDVQYTVD